MAAKVVRLVWNFATLKDGSPNPEFQPDLPTCAMQMLSVDSIPPEWSFEESQCVRFPSHEAAEVRVEELRALGIRCHAQTLPRDPNQRPAFESLPPAPLKQLLPTPVLAEPCNLPKGSANAAKRERAQSRQAAVMRKLRTSLVAGKNLQSVVAGSARLPNCALLTRA
jgi:hypothetical protein